jgi:hypothetical protein
VAGIGQQAAASESPGQGAGACEEWKRENERWRGLGLDCPGRGGPAGPKKGFGLLNWLDRPS